MVVFILHSRFRNILNNSFYVVDSVFYSCADVDFIVYCVYNGVAGGITGYLRGFKTKTIDALEKETDPVVPQTPKEDLVTASRAIDDTADYLEQASALREPTPVRIMDEEYVRFLNKEYASLEQAQ